MPLRAFPIAYDLRPIGKYLASGRISRLRTVPERVEVLPAMQVQRDDAALADRVVMDFVQTHGHTTMDALVRSLVTLSWAQVFSAVDRLSRTHQIQLHQTRHRDYTIRMRDSFIPRPVLTQIIRPNNASTLRS